ncbi:MAG: DUF4350 domain-containing protein [Acidimicrobiia bacterium]
MSAPVSTARGWRGLHPAARVTIVIVLAVIAVNVGLQLLDSTTRGADETAPRSSSFSTGSTGVAAWAELLRRNGASTSAVRGSLDDEGLAVDSTLVVLDPDSVSGEEERAVRAFVDAGGRLVAGGASSTGLLSALLDRSPDWSPDGVRRVRPDGDAPEVDGIDVVATEGDGSWEELGETEPILADGEVVVATVAEVGAGRVVMLADTSLLQNRLLDRADNAAFALQIVGDSTIVRLAEGQHGYGDATGLGAIPGRWKLALVGLALASLVGAVAAGRRLGPPEDEARALPPPRRAYVDAMAESLERTRRPVEALAPLQAATRARLARRAGLRPDSSEEELRAGAIRLGWSATEVEALFAPTADDAAVMAAGNALARVTGGERA